MEQNYARMMAIFTKIRIELGLEVSTFSKFFKIHDQKTKVGVMNNFSITFLRIFSVPLSCKKFMNFYLPGQKHFFLLFTLFYPFHILAFTLSLLIIFS